MSSHFSAPLFIGGVPTFGGGGVIPPTFGKVYFVDADNGSDGYSGKSPAKAFATVAQAYSVVRTNKDDVIVMSSVSAHTISDEITVSKNRVHFVGDISGGARYMGQRTRWEMGTTTGSAIAVLQVTGVGNTFTGIKFRSTDDLSTSLYAVADGGEFTQFICCSFEKDEDLNQTGAAEFLCNADTGYYYRCSFGNCIYTVSVARAVVLFTRETITGKVARDCVFEDCIFMNKTSATTSIHCKATTSDIERVCLFKDCVFWTAKTSSATQAVVFGIASALTDGEILLKDCTVQNVTDVCATALGVYTNSPAPSATGTESSLVAVS